MLGAEIVSRASATHLNTDDGSHAVDVLRLGETVSTTPQNGGIGFNQSGSVDLGDYVSAVTIA